MVGESLPAQEKGPFLCGQPHVSRMLRFRVRSYNGKWERHGTSAVDACMPGYKFEGCGLCACALSRHSQVTQNGSEADARKVPHWQSLNRAAGSGRSQSGREDAELGLRFLFYN